MTDRRLKPKRRGFSFLELVIILLVISIFAATAVTRYSAALHRYRADNVARRIAADLELAASEAQRTSQPRQVQFDAGAEIYTLLNVDDVEHPGQTYVVDLANSEYRAVLTSVDFNSTSVASFDMYGRPVNAGTVVVRSGTESRTVTLNADGSITLP